MLFRSYRGWWQNIPRELRQYITIDGEPCSELDYSGQHLLLLYGLEGDEYRWLKGLNDDPYYLEDYGEDVRSLLKVAVLILVNETNEDKVALEKEINHLKKFIQVYQLRIAEDDDVFINFAIKGDIENIKISPMMLIPFVENAIKHGIDTKVKSRIYISLEVTQNKLSYKVSNTIHQAVYGLKDGASGFGLDNLKKRLSILYPNVHTLETKVEKGFFISLISNTNSPLSQSAR